MITGRGINIMKRETARKRFLLCMALVFAAGTISGCAGGRNKYSGVDSDGEIPASLTIFSDVGINIPAAGGTDYNDCLTFQLLEEKTGCHVEWKVPASGAKAERFNMMMASGSLPDAIVYDWINAPGGAQAYIDDGIIVDITDYIDECMPNFSKILKENPEIKRDVVNDDGRIYTIPLIRIDKELGTYQGPVIREDWLNKLGLDIPKTPDELYNVLKAFKTQDPNGNGQADEIPMTGNKFSGSTGIEPLMWPFGTITGFYLKDDEVVYGPLMPEYKEALEYVVKLFSEGLIDQDYLLNTRSKVDAKFTGNISGFGFGFQPTTYYAPMNDGTRKVTGIGYLTGKDGKKYCFNEAYVQRASAVTALAITNVNKNVAGTLKWLDELFGGEGMMFANYGKEGETYEIIDGKPVFSETITNNPNGKTQAEMIALTCAVRDGQFPMVTTWDYYKQTLAPWGIEAVETWQKDGADTSCIMPLVSRNAEETEIYANKITPIKTFVEEEVNKVITGKSSMNDWDSVAEKIKNMGIEEILEIQNAAYKRYKDR